MNEIDRERHHYSQKNYNNYLYKGLIGVLFRYQHKRLSPKDYRNNERVLEIGPGFEPHIKYVKLNFKEYYCLELNNNKELIKYYENNFPNIIYKNYDGRNLNFPENFFDRIIISHTLEHIINFEEFLIEMHRVLKIDGVISIASPCDNGFLWRFCRFLLKKTYFKLLKVSDLDYDYNLAKDHVNTIFQIISVLRKKFTIISEYYLPFKIKIIDFNLIHICHLRK
jgi:ubiquinone/menaquinone biosynthesis C-methylase UbiE